MRIYKQKIILYNEQMTLYESGEKSTVNICLGFLAGKLRHGVLHYNVNTNMAAILFKVIQGQLS